MEGITNNEPVLIKKYIPGMMHLLFSIQSCRSDAAISIQTQQQCYLHRGTCLNAMKRFCICSLLIPPKRFDTFPPITGGCSEGLGVV